MSDNGGIIKFRLPTGSNLTVRGSVTRNPAFMSAETIANASGTLDRSFTVQGYRFAMSLADKDVDGNPVGFDALLALDKVDFTFLHDTERVDYHYGRAHLAGDPSIDASTGEVSGITGAAETYLAVPR